MAEPITFEQLAAIRERVTKARAQIEHAATLAEMVAVEDAPVLFDALDGLREQNERLMGFARQIASWQYKSTHDAYGNVVGAGSPYITRCPFCRGLLTGSAAMDASQGHARGCFMPALLALVGEADGTPAQPAPEPEVRYYDERERLLATRVPLDEPGKYKLVWAVPRGELMELVRVVGRGDASGWYYTLDFIDIVVNRASAHEGAE